MFRKQLLLRFLLPLLFCQFAFGAIASSAASPSAAFTFSPDNPAAGQMVAFTDASTGDPTSWLWSFGDGMGSIEQNPTHVFAAAGIYEVALTASNASGSSSAMKIVGVTSAPAAPVADFTFLPGSPRPGQLVQFVDASTGGTGTSSWNFGDPASGPGNSSALQNPTHAFLSPGTYTVTLTVANGFGSSRKSRDVTVCGRCPRVVPFR
jgi:PKD repeat protein